MSAALDLLLPFYGPPELLRETVTSALAQTEPDWRLVVVDDAWPGEPVGPWLAALGDDRIVYLRNPVTLGINRNFQRCLDLAEADHVAFPGGDDVLLPSYAATVLSAARATGAELVQPGVRVIDAEGRTVRPLGDRVKRVLAPRTTAGSVVLTGEDLVASLARGNWTYFPSWCVRRDALAGHGFTEGFDTVLDFRLLLDLAFGGARVAVVPEVCFSYRRHDDSFSSLSARSVDRFDEEAALLDWVRAECERAGWHRAARAAALRPASRLHALSLLPGAWRQDRLIRRRLLRHVVSWPRAPR